MDARPLTFHEFARLTEVIGTVAREAGLVVPGFRSPPRRRGLVRSLRRNEQGLATVAVVLRGRPASAVVTDLVDGVCAVNQLRGARAVQLRARVRERLATEGLPGDGAVARAA